MISKKIQNFIKNNNQEIITTGGIDKNKIEFIESHLGLKIPNVYKDFLIEYGMLLGYGIEILGWGKSDEASVIKETIRNRKLGMPTTYIVIQSYDEWVYCIDCSGFDKDECEIIEWDRVNKKEKAKEMTFEEFLLNSLENGKQLWEEDF